ncbi:MAG: DinB family protein [Pyrinomonadaceae bacterium]
MNTTNASTDALRMLFGLNYDVLKGNLEAISHEESLIQPPGGGNCLNWVLGHIVATRDMALELLKQQPVWRKEEADTYRRGSAPIQDGSRAKNLDQIIADLHRSQDRLLAGLTEVLQPQLNAPAGDQSVGEMLFTLQMHEAYHAGQTGLLRRMAGHEGAIK